jgi:hypothetical protein
MYLDILRVKYVYKCELPKNAICFWSITSTFSVSPGFCIRFLPHFQLYLLGGRDSRHSPIRFHSALLRLRYIGNHCNYHGNHMCLVNCCHRKACSVLCIGVGTRLANCYLVMGDVTVGAMFAQPLAGTYSNVSRKLQF